MSVNDTGTVVGPGCDTIPQGLLLTPPTLKPETDSMQWRKDIRDWSKRVIACAKGGDTREKGIASCLDLTVYRLLDFSLKEEVKESIPSGEIVLNLSEGSNVDSQLKMIEKIISTVAKDTAVDRVTRMVRLNIKIYKFVRKDGESIKQYVNRLKAPDIAYLNLTHNGQQ